MTAEVGLGEVTTTTLRNRTKKLKDNIGNNNAAFFYMKKNGGFEGVDGGRTLVEEVMSAENGSFLWYSDAQVLNTGYNPTITAFEYPWKQAAVAVTMTGYEERINSGSAAAIKLMASRIKVAEITMKNQLNAAFYGNGTAFGGKTLGGLDLLVSKTPTTGTIGGIDRATATWARNYTLPVVSTFGVAANASNIKQIFTRTIINTTRDGDNQTMALLGNSYFEYVMTAAQSTQMFTDGETAHLGFRNVIFEGIPVFLGGGVNMGGETLIGDTEGYVLNTEFLKLKYHQDCFMDPLEDRMSVNQDAMVKYIAFMGNFTGSNLRLQARIFDS